MFILLKMLSQATAMKTLPKVEHRHFENKPRMRGKMLQSSLHCSFSLLFCSLLYYGVYCNQLKLSVNDVIVSQKGSVVGSMETESYDSMGRTIILLALFMQTTTLP